ncbi:hypothetical protein BDW22DRAFT_1011787 [Trametopsis cervina]|nr:hypothetical protein BDW22DRAFT_1011787 [Trametopsis cervina]
MSSAGSESPLPIAQDQKPLPNLLEKICKKGATFAKASDFLNELRSHSPGPGSDGLPDGITSLCAFIASEQLENKDVSVGVARSTSGLTWDQFWRSVAEVQDLLVKAANRSSQFQYTRLPAYEPPCDTCEAKQFECVRKIAPSTKCQVCSIRKKVCTRQDTHEKRKNESKEVVRPRKSSSPRDREFESLLNDMDAKPHKPLSSKVVPSPTLSPKWTTIDDIPATSYVRHGHHHRQLSDADERSSVASSTKRKSAAPQAMEGDSKKRRLEFEAGSTKRSPLNGLDKHSPYSAHATATQGHHNLHTSAHDHYHPNGSTASSSSTLFPARKYPRPPSPTSSEDGHGHRYPKAWVPTVPGHTDEVRILNESLQKKAREVVVYVEGEGCKGIGLRLHILDMKTRLVELDRTKSEPVPSKSNVSALEGMLRRAAASVVQSLKNDGCADVNLRLLVLDLDTRLAEMERER